MRLYIVVSSTRSPSFALNFTFYLPSCMSISIGFDIMLMILSLEVMGRSNAANNCVDGIVVLVCMTKQSWQSLVEL